MSKVPYTVNVDEYVCCALEEIRTMCKTSDFSRLLATVERIQHHANQMEAGLNTYNGSKHRIKRILDDDDMSNSKKLIEIAKEVTDE